MGIVANILYGVAGLYLYTDYVRQQKECDRKFEQGDKLCIPSINWYAVALITSVYAYNRYIDKENKSTKR